MGKPEAALTDYNTALAIAPNATAILRNRASLYLEMDSVESAFDDFKKISSLNPKDVDSRYYMGIIALEFGDMVLSLQCFEDVLALDEKNADARRGLCVVEKVERIFGRSDCIVWRDNKVGEQGDKLHESRRMLFGVGTTSRSAIRHFGSPKIRAFQSRRVFAESPFG